MTFQQSAPGQYLRFTTLLITGRPISLNPRKHSFQSSPSNNPLLIILPQLPPHLLPPLLPRLIHIRPRLPQKQLRRHRIRHPTPRALRPRRKNPLEHRHRRLRRALVPRLLKQPPAHILRQLLHFLHQPIERIILRFPIKPPPLLADHFHKRLHVGKARAAMGFLFVREEVPAAGGRVAGERAVGAAADEAGGLPEDFEEEGVRGGGGGGGAAVVLEVVPLRVPAGAGGGEGAGGVGGAFYARGAGVPVGGPAVEGGFGEEGGGHGWLVWGGEMNCCCYCCFWVLVFWG
ncbi:hypothetical protein BDR22DRAFT_580035 [Usnea florida]